MADGSHEFRSLLHRRRLAAQQIISVRPDEDVISVRYRGGQLRVLEMHDFPDFLARLKELNPAVEVEGF